MAALWQTRTAAGSRWTAARAATIMAVALLTLWSIGRLDLALYASFGAFASVHGERLGPVDGGGYRASWDCSCLPR